MGERSERGSRAPGTRATDGVVQQVAGKRPLVQRRPVQRKQAPWPAVQRRAEGEGAGGGLPAGLKGGVESLSGVSMDDVQVHRDSAKPAEVGALAYAQGNDIHLGPGQDQHLPHEAWHTAQQKQGRVSESRQAKGLPINDDEALENEADEMGDKALEVGDAAGKKAEKVAPAVTGGDDAAGAEREGEASEPIEPEVAQMKAVPGGGVVQRIKKKGVVVDVTTLAADEVKEHISRSFRLKAGKGVGDDTDYEYAADDLGKLKERQKQLQDAEVTAKHTTLVADLTSALAGLATAGSFVTPPPWDGKNAAGSPAAEVYKPNPMAADASVVIARWKAFLGPGPYSSKHPRTGVPEAGKLTSGDGKRSIRYGDHEKAVGNPNAHHFHEESWTYDAGANAMSVLNEVQKVPVT